MGNRLDVLEKHGYTEVREIGSGGFGKAILVKCKHDGKEYVLKKIIMNETFPRESAIDELSLLKKMDHPYIVHYKESFEEGNSLYIVMEYCGKGDLHKMLKDQREKGVYFQEKEVLDWFVQICLAVKHVHDQHIIHRDIKPENIFVTTEGTLRLGDFGISKELPGSQAFTTTPIGTPGYMAPEIFKAQRYTFSSDIWSLGVVLHNLCNLSYTDQDYRKLPNHYSKDLQDLVNLLLQRNPAKRPKINDILKKPILARRVPKHHKIEVLKTEFDSDLLTSMGLDENNSFLKDEELITEITSELDENIKSFSSFFSKDDQHLQKEIGNLHDITNQLETLHRKTTIGSLTGGVMGVAGGITSIVGLILAPFTFGASLIVTGVGIGVAALGGATGAVSGITNMVQQKTLRKNIEDILTNFQDKISPTLLSMNTINSRLSKMQEYSKTSLGFTSTTLNGQCTNVNMDKLLHFLQIAKLGSIGRVAAQATRVASAASKTIIVLSSLMLILDIVFIVKDSIEIHEMNKLKKNPDEEGSPIISEAEANEIKSNMLKFIAQMRCTVVNFNDTLKELKKMKTVLDNEVIPFLSMNS